GKDFWWWAVGVAATAGTGTAFIIGSWIGPPFQHWFSARGLSLEEVYRTMVQSIGFGVVVVLLSAFGYSLAGYTAASLAPGRPVVHAVVAALICMATWAVYYLGVFPNRYPAWLQALGFIISIPCAVLGALYCRRRAPPNPSLTKGNGLR